MSNTILTPTAITREALKILHNNLTFTKNANRQYDSQFANSGATMSGKIGPNLTVRMPNKYVVRTGATMNVQDTAETSKTISCSTQKGVDMSFSAQDLTLSIDEFSQRFIKPAALLLASTIDYDGLSLYKDVYNYVGDPTATPSALLTWLQGSAKMTDLCCPIDDRMAVMTPLTSATMVNTLAGQYNPQQNISKMYIKGQMSEAAGLKWAYTQNIATHTCGSRTASGDIIVAGAGTEGMSTITFTCTTTGKTFTAGDVFSIASVKWVNPETKNATGSTAYFTVSANATDVAGTTTLTFTPAMYASGAAQNVSALPADSAAVTFVGAASDTYKGNMIHHKDAFALVTADLINPKDTGAWGAREVYDGISLRIVKQYNIVNDRFDTRLDVLYGWKTLYPEWACRVVGD